MANSIWRPDLYKITIIALRRLFVMNYKLTNINREDNEDFIFQKIEIVSFILALIIMFMHSKNIHLYSNINSCVIYFETFVTYTLGPLAVPTFFMISGYLFFRAPVIEKDNKANISNWLQKIYRRFFTVAIPYFTWNLIDYILFILLSISPIGVLMATDTVSIDFNEIISAIFLYKYNSVYWYMAQLILFSIASVFLYFLLKHPCSILLVLFFTALSIVSNQDIFRFNSFAFWVLGSWIGVHKPKCILTKIHPSYAKVSLLATTLVLAIRFILNDVFYISNDFINEYLLLLNTIFLWFSFDALPYNKMTLRWWQSITFFIYSSHPLILDGVKKMLIFILPKNTFFAIIIYFVSVIITLIIVIMLAQISRRYLKSIWNILNGNRNKV